LGKAVRKFLELYDSRGGTGTVYYRSRTTVFLNFFGESTPVVEISRLKVAQFVKHRVKVDGCGPSTIRKDLIALGTLFKFIEGVLDTPVGNPADPKYIRRPPAPPGREFTISDDEFERVPESASLQVKRVMEWLRCSGMRLGEGCSLRWKDLDKRPGYVWVRPGKTGKGRFIPYSRRLREVVNAIPRPIQGVFVFTNERGRAHHPNTMCHYIKRAFVKAELGEGSAHTLRHTFASRMAGRGSNVAFIPQNTTFAGSRPQGESRSESQFECRLCQTSDDDDSDKERP
jgi:integrase